MSLPFPLPDWLPWWVPIAVLVPALFYALMFLFMPFSVIGVRGRLDSIEARLDEIQGEIRSLALRLREPLPAAAYDEAPLLADPPVAREPYASPSPRPPIPPAPYYPDAVTPAADGSYRGRGAAGPRRPEPPAPRRAEPRLDWPR